MGSGITVTGLKWTARRWPKAGHPKSSGLKVCSCVLGVPCPWGRGDVSWLRGELASAHTWEASGAVHRRLPWGPDLDRDSAHGAWPSRLIPTAFSRAGPASTRPSQGTSGLSAQVTALFRIPRQSLLCAGIWHCTWSLGGTYRGKPRTSHWAAFHSPPSWPQVLPGY